jgi:osmotically-inducible protein OsmY
LVTGVKAASGVVTLRGQASSEGQRELAGEYAEDIEGVREVVNEITVSTEKENLAKLNEEAIDDASVSAQIRVALLTHRSTRSSHINVATSEGVVTLRGGARNESENALISKLVDDICGVKKVVNKIAVEGEPLDR